MKGPIDVGFRGLSDCKTHNLTAVIRLKSKFMLHAIKKGGDKISAALTKLMIVFKLSG